MYKKLHILSADDDLDDQDLIEEALKKTGYEHLLSRVPDGAKLLNYLNNITSSNANLPDVIFLDLNMPIKDGRETLRTLKAMDSTFRNIPVAMLTTSSALEDIRHCINLGADHFLVKPNSFNTLVQMLENTLSDLQKKNLN